MIHGLWRKSNTTWIAAYPLLIIAAIALGGAIGIAVAIGRGAARPVEVLSAAVRRIEAGSYDEPVRLRGAS